MSEGAQYEQGTIKFIAATGYGFIERDGKSDVYFHLERLEESVRSTIRAGHRVTVAVGQGKKGPVAMKVIPLDNA